MNTAFDEKKWLEDELEQFMLARQSRPVINQIMVPDSSLEKFKNFHLAWDDKAFHRSVPFMANKRGVIDGLCGPLQRIIFDLRGGPSALSKQYQSDLKETWYLADDFNKRRDQCNKFMGKVLEFHTAEFVQNHYGWKLVYMEAFKKQTALPDILCSTKSNEAVAVSCKVLCESPEVFDLNIQAIANNGALSGWLSIYTPIDYLLYRICESAWGLQEFKDARKVIVVLLVYSANFKLQPDDNWIDFSDLRFMDRDSQLAQFWDTQKEKKKEAVETLKNLSTFVDGVVICSIGDGYQLSICKEHWYREINK